MTAVYRTVPPSASDVSFVYHGWQFALGVDPISSSAYLPRVLWRRQGVEHMALPTPPESFVTEAIALQHAQTQAVRWVHDYLQSPRRIAFNEDGIFRKYPELDA